MSSLTYSNYPGFGEQAKEKFYYSQAVRIGDRIECSGQGGWNPDNGSVVDDMEAQIDQAFKNVELALKAAGGKGWSQVYKVRSHHAGLNDAAMAAMVRNLKQWSPDHSPIWTALGVAKLALDGMKVEIEVYAYDA